MKPCTGCNAPTAGFLCSEITKSDIIKLAGFAGHTWCLARNLPRSSAGRSMHLAQSFFYRNLARGVMRLRQGFFLVQKLSKIL